jgi:hypothetical protein
VENYLGILFDAPKVYLQAAVGRAELGEVLIEKGHAPAQIGILFHEDYVCSCFGGFNGSGHPAYTASDYQDFSLFITHELPPCNMSGLIPADLQSVILEALRGTACDAN